MLKGVSSVLPGYAGGHVKNPTYEQVSTGDTGHIEVIKIEYDPDKIAFEEILQVFFEDARSDHRQPARQRCRPAVSHGDFLHHAAPKGKSRALYQNDRLKYTKPIVTTVAPLDTFYIAEDYHQKYYENHKDAGYCQVIIEPKVEKVQEKFKNLLK